MKFRTQYDEPLKEKLECGKKGAVQSEKESCDINNILKRFEEKGQLSEMIEREPRYGDFSSVPDYQESLEIVIKAEEQFNALPAKVRDRFEGKPEKFLAFVADVNNKEEMEKMGLLQKKQSEVIQKVEVINYKVVPDEDQKETVSK